MIKLIKLKNRLINLTIKQTNNLIDNRFAFVKNFNSQVRNNLEDIIKEIKSEDGKNIVDIGLLHSINENNGKYSILLNLNKDYRKIKSILESKLRDRGINDFEINIAPQEKKSESPKKPGLSKVKNIIAVYSCKGGVGKSTIAINLAISLLQNKQKVGIFDADIYGPSLPVLISPEKKEVLSYEKDPKLIIPIEFSGLKAMSFGFVAPGRRAIMRGPMVSNLVTNLITNTDWGDLDFLIVDMPPGTGDIHISLCQDINFTGGIVITTPQKLSFVDVVKGIEMFDELKIPILAVIENMSYFICDNCSEKHYIYGNGYINMLKKQFGIEESFGIPMDPLISKVSDNGTPYMLVASDSALAYKEYTEISNTLIKKTSNLQNILNNKPKLSYDPKEGVLNLESDNRIKKISPMHLRKKCICAACIDEFSGVKLIKDKNIPENIYPTRMEDKGNYAVAIVWSDGHRSSIYPYKRLLSNDIESISL